MNKQPSKLILVSHLYVRAVRLKQQKQKQPKKQKVDCWFGDLVKTKTVNDMFGALMANVSAPISVGWHLSKIASK